MTDPVTETTTEDSTPASDAPFYETVMNDVKSFFSESFVSASVYTAGVVALTLIFAAL